MSAPELKPCPFCGGKATVWTTDAYSCDSAEHVIGCKECDIYMPFAGVFEKAEPTEADVATWNRRADLPLTDAEVMAHPKVKALVEALQFYADKSNWFSEVPYLGTAAANIDLGDISRAALAALKGS